MLPIKGQLKHVYWLACNTNCWLKFLKEKRYLKKDADSAVLWGVYESWFS